MLKKVMVGVPCLYGKVDGYFFNSYIETLKLCEKNNIQLQSILLINESILPMARNEILNLAYLEKYDSLVFIDDDEKWNPEDFLEIIQSEKDVVGLPVVNKGDLDIKYNVFLDDQNKIFQDSTDGYIKTNKIGTGFLKLSNKVISDLWNSNTSIEFRGKILKSICEYEFNDNFFIGEDITLCKKIRELGYDIWVKPNSTVEHIGPKIYKGDFNSFLKNNFEILK